MCTNHIVEFFNYPNSDGTLTDVKFYFKKQDEVYYYQDCVSKTVAQIDGEEVEVSDEIDQVLFIELKEQAIVKLIDYECFDNRYLDFDKGGSFE